MSGTLPGTLTFTNSGALNEVFQPITFGKTITFVVLLSGPAIDAPNGTSTSGSTFSVGLYDSTQNPILTDQGQLSGAAGQLNINLDGTVTAIAYPNASEGPSVVTFTASPALFIPDWWWFYTYP